MPENDDDSNPNPHRTFWEEFCKEFIGRLTAYALKLAKGKVCDAEDYVQETIRRILTYPKNPEEIESPFSYLCAIMRNVRFTMWRMDGRGKVDSLDALLSKDPQQEPHRGREPSVEPDAPRILENNEYRTIMHAKLGPLTPDENLLLRLRLEGFSCKEIAEKLGEDVSLVRLRWNALRTKIINRVRRDVERR
ncbi:MAG TPA: RNA polymerase sigma factor [Blastocatellia bacterium]|nr:RNA polymerase sigma factor [Blastocatellia bacterium]